MREADVTECLLLSAIGSKGGNRMGCGRVINILMTLPSQPLLNSPNTLISMQMRSAPAEEGISFVRDSPQRWERKEGRKQDERRNEGMFQAT